MDFPSSFHDLSFDILRFNLQQYYVSYVKFRFLTKRPDTSKITDGSSVFCGSFSSFHDLSFDIQRFNLQQYYVSYVKFRFLTKRPDTSKITDGSSVFCGSPLSIKNFDIRRLNADF